MFYMLSADYLLGNLSVIQLITLPSSVLLIITNKKDGSLLHKETR